MRGYKQVFSILFFTALGLYAGTAFALDRTDVIFYSGFEDTLTAEIAKGEQGPVSAGAHEFAEGITGKGVIVDGRITYSYGNNINPEESTVSFWMKPSGWGSTDLKTGQYNFFVVHGTPAMQVTSVYWGVTRFYIYYPGEKNTANVFKYYRFERDKWYHIAVAWKSGKEAKFFINGVLINRITDKVPEVRSGVNFSMGAPMTIFDELIILKRALKDEEITALFFRDLR